MVSFNFLRTLVKGIRPKKVTGVMSNQIVTELNHTAKIAGQSNNLLMKSFIEHASKSLKVINNTLHIGSLAVKHFLSYIFDNTIAKAMQLGGFATTFFKKSNFKKIKNFLTQESQLLPEHHLHKVAKVEKVLVENYSEIVEAATKPAARSRFNWLVKSAKAVGKWLTFKKILIGAGMTLVGLEAYDFIEEYRKVLSGCIRHYVDPQTLEHKMCRVANGACNFELPTKLNNLIPTCDISLILPVITSFNCKDIDSQEPHCPHCDSATDPVLSQGDSNVVYICSTPSFLETTAQIVAKAKGHLIDAIFKIGNTILDNSVNIIQILSFVVMGVIGIVGIGVAIYAIRILNFISPPSNNTDDISPMIDDGGDDGGGISDNNHNTNTKKHL
ncbi:MAG: per os infectivity factor pif-5 [Cotesia congregata filamentous virus 2]